MIFFILNKLFKKHSSKPNWRPLSEKLTIEESGIEGLGLFAVEDIPKNYNLGMSHIVLGEEIVRTSTGGFYNHSNEPNCVKVRVGNKYYLKTLREINLGEEITVKYTFYDVED